MQYAHYELKKSGNDALDSLIAKTYGLQNSGSTFVLYGNLNDIYDDLLGIQELARHFNVSDAFEAEAERIANAMYNPWKALEGKKHALEDAGKKLEYLTTTYDILINSDEKVIVGRFHKNSIYREEAKYLEYVKNTFGEEIADAIEDVSSIYIGRGLNGQFADFEIYFKKLKLSDSQKEQITMSYDTFYSELLAKQKTAQGLLQKQMNNLPEQRLRFMPKTEKQTPKSLPSVV